MKSRRKFVRKLVARSLPLVLALGTTFWVAASDQPRREGAKMTETTENPQDGQNAQTGTSNLEDQTSVAITVYNSNLGLVKDTRTLKLPRGTSQLRFMNVAQQINATTVHIKSLTAPNTLNVVEQSYEYDLLNPQKLLDKYVGQELTLVLRAIENNTEKLTPTRATLLSNNSGQVWQIGGQVVINPTNIAEIRFERLPQDLIAKPTLVWTLNNTGADTHTVEASYLTQGINWRSDYVVVVNQNDTKADLNGWVTVTNNSGTTYRNADLKLVAGDVNRVRDEVLSVKSARVMEMAAAGAAQPQFQEQAFFEYHLYTLQRKATIKNNETKQISLLSAADFGIKKELVVNGQSYYFQGYNNPGESIKEKVGVYVSFKNGKENGLGQPESFACTRPTVQELSSLLGKTGLITLRKTKRSKSNLVMLLMSSRNESRRITITLLVGCSNTPMKSESGITRKRP